MNKPLHALVIEDELLIALDIEEQSDGYFSFSHGTLYPILHQLEKEGMIHGTWDAGSGRRRSRLTRGLLVALLDNLGKGASGAAVQSLNLMAGLEETTGLRL